MSQQPVSESSRKQQKDSRVVDALWINIKASENSPLGKFPQAYYFDLQSDGRFVFAEGDDYSTMKVVRLGVLPEKLVRRAFHIVSKPSVVNAHDTDPGEPIFSDSDWVSIGLMLDGKVKARGGWAYQEEFKDFPAEFRELIPELKSVAAKLPQATNIKALLSADVVEPWRMKLIDLDHFIVLDEEGLNRLPALRQAVSMSRRMVAVEDEAQMSQFAELARRINPQSVYSAGYKIEGRGYYEVGAYYFQRPRALPQRSHMLAGEAIWQ